MVQAPRPNAGRAEKSCKNRWVKSRRRRKRKKKKKKKKKEKKKKVGENNGQLRFVRHRVWRTQARLDQKHSPIKCKVYSERKKREKTTFQKVVSTTQQALNSIRDMY